MLRTLLLTLLILLPISLANAEQQWVTYEGTHGPGFGRHIVLIAGDDEYRSEEAMPMLGQILARHHGFKCTVLFPVNPETGEIQPDYQTNIPGMHLLPTADLVILFTRFRELPDQDMKYFDDYFRSGKPVMGLRTATHGFNYARNKNSPFAKYDWRNAGPDWNGGFGKEVFGETWYTHHGHHKKESTRGVINKDMSNHPILNSVSDLWGPSDVYGIRKLHGNAQVLVYGEVLAGMDPESPAVEGEKNDPMMPVAWIREYEHANKRKSRIFCSTFCSAKDLECEDLRRLLVNASFWSLKLEDKIPEKAKVEYVNEYNPTMFGFNIYQKELKPSDFSW